MPERPRAVPPSSGLFPLSEFYIRSNVPMPPVQPLSGPEVPEPYRSLLVHSNDMTPTLERFHGGEIYIDAVCSERHPDGYFREVVLRRTGDDAPVEFGANCINLDGFSPEARWMILQEKVPLGRILKDHRILHTTRPVGFFRIQPDKLIATSLRLTDGAVLYGRQAVLSDVHGGAISQVVEVLPPI